MPTTGPETWKPLEATDFVFWTRENKRFVAYSGPAGTFIGTVCLRDGVWMKRTDPLKPFSPLTIRDLVVWDRYRLGAELLAGTPHTRHYLRVA